MTAVEIDRVLVPLDHSEESLGAVECAVAVAERYDADVHVLYVLSEEVAYGIDSGDIDEATVATETAEFVDAVHGLAGDVAMSHSTAMGFSPRRLTQHPGSVILDAADEVEADFLVVPREPITGEPGAILGKAAEYVLMYASQPVLSV